MEPFYTNRINCSIMQQSWTNWGEIFWPFTPMEGWAVCCWNLCVLFKNVQVDDVCHNVGTKQKLPRDAVRVPEQSQWDCSHKHFGKLSLQKNHFANGLCHVVAVPHPCMWFGLVGQWQWFGDTWELCPVCITGWAEGEQREISWYFENDSTGLLICAPHAGGWVHLKPGAWFSLQIMAESSLYMEIEGGGKDFLF